MKFLHHYQTLDARLYHHQPPKPLDNPRLGHLNTDKLSELGLPVQLDWQAIIGGHLDDWQALDADMNPLAMVYAGHQFGQWAGRLGDGRGLLIGEIDHQGACTELHLKGAGRTPYSRHGDGRAMIDSTVREYLCGHALNHLGIASSDAIGFVVSDTPIQRANIERAAMLLRTSDCHVRLGHLEYVALYTPDYLPTFVDRMIERYYPHLHKSRTQKPTDLLGFIHGLCENTARLIAQWQLVGFSHGVMNTDNLNLTGSTLDFGPFGFMEGFNPTWINNHSDHTARYCYQNQPAIGHWNLKTVLMHFGQLSISPQEISDALDHYERVFLDTYHQGLLNKLGLLDHQPADEDTITLAYEFLKLLQNTKSDYTNSFRMLSAVLHPKGADDHESRLLERFTSQLGTYTKDWLNWQSAYLDRLATKSETQKLAQQAKLRRTNPAYVLRNHMAQAAIEGALADDFREVARLFDLLKHPFDIQAIATEADTRMAKPHEQVAVSCMS